MTYAIAFADAAQLEGAAAVVIRDPAAELAELIVLPGQHVTDLRVVHARFFLSRDKREFPQVGSRRVLTLATDGLLRLDVDGRTKRRRSNPVFANVSDRNAANLHARQQSGRKDNADGIDDATLVLDPTQ